VKARRGDLAVVDGDHALVLGGVDEHEAAAADAAAERVGDAERGRRGHRGVDRVAAGVEDLHRGQAGLVRDGGDRAAVAGVDRLLRQRAEGGHHERGGEEGAVFS
jgi:hypothetical protein